MGKIKNWEKIGDGYWAYQHRIPEDAPPIFKKRIMYVNVTSIPNPETDPYPETMREGPKIAYMEGFRWRVDMMGIECPNKDFLCHPFRTLKEATAFAIDFMKSHPNGYSYHTNYEY